MTRVVLVYPPIIFGRKERLGLPPLGVLYIATFLLERGVDTRFIDSSIRGHTAEKLVDEILKENPEIVGFSAMTCQIRSVLEIAEELKSKKPSLKIIVGGHHVNATKDELFKFTSAVDFLFYGEGENEFYNLVKTLEEKDSLEKIRGLIYKKNGETIVNEPPLPIQNLDELPFPNLELLDVGQYDIYYAKSFPLTSLLASRGCPHNCIYCSASIAHGKFLRLRSPGNVVDEMERDYTRYKIRQFIIKDSVFTANKKWVHEICTEIRNRNLKINWSCNARADQIDEDLLKAMRGSGCHSISFGIESGSQKILDVLQKGLTIAQIKNGIALCKKAGIETIGTFMVGNPTETEEDAQKTVKLLRELDLDLAFVLVTIAYPGTLLYRWALQNQTLEDKLWYMKKNTASFTGGWEINGSLNLPAFPRKNIIEIVKRANKSFYLRPAFILKRLRKIGKFSDMRRNLMSFKKLLWKG